MTAHFCESCDRATDNGYWHAGKFYCVQCWEDWQRRQARDALGNEKALSGPGYNESRRCKANYRRR